MVDVTIVYWRDLAARVIVGNGRRGSGRKWPERFARASARAAMTVAAVGAEAARPGADHDRDRLKAPIANDGRA